MTPEEYVSHKRDVSQRAHEHQVRRAEAGELHGGDWTEYRPYKSRADALRQIRPEALDEKAIRREHMEHVNRARVQGRSLRPEVAQAYGL